MAEISQIKLPSGTAYMLKDVGALQLTGGTVTGPTTFSDTISVDDATIGTMIVNGAASFTNTIQANNFKTVEFNSSTDQYKSINCDVTKAEVEAQGTLTSSSSNSDWLQALVKAICIKYPGKTYTVFRGELQPNSSGYYKVLIYNTSNVDSTTKLPEHCYGTFRKLTDVYEKFWTYSYTWGHGSINTNTDTKVTITAVTPSSETTNYLLTYTATSGTVGVNANAKARMWEKEGTTSSGGYISLALGNNVATGTDGNSTGNIYLYGTTAYFNKIAPGGPTSNLTQTLPTNGSGTLINTVGGQTIDSTLQIKNVLTLYREGTTANDSPAGIQFKNKDTTTGHTYEGAHLYVYQDHGSTATNGCSIVLKPGGNMFLGSGEAPSNHYALYKSSANENTYITADSYLYAQAGGGTIANRKGFRIDASGNVIPCQADTDTNNVGSIGTSSYKWADLYVTNINGVAVGTSPKFTDNNNYVTQGTTTTTSWRKVLLHYTTNTQGGNVPADVTNVIYAAKGLEVQPSTGVLSAGGYIGPGSIEYIKGTQTGSTNAWTGTTKEAALYDGKMIMYVLPYAGTSTGATLNLTLSGGGTTGAKSIYRYAATTAVTTHFAAGSRILMIYDSSNTRWNTVAYYNTTYSTMSAAEIKTGTATTQRVMTAAQIKAGICDLFYPVGSYYETSLTDEIPSGASTPNATDLANLGVTWFNPNYAWTGTWEKISDHTVLISAHETGTYALGSTGGSVSRSIELSNLPPGMIRSSGTKTSRQIKALTGGSDYYTVTSASAWTVSNTSTQNGFSVMQPWVAVNRWHRTA